MQFIGFFKHSVRQATITHAYNDPSAESKSGKQYTDYFHSSGIMLVEMKRWLG